MKNKKIIIGSRGSKLALIYANKAKDKIIQNTSLEENNIIIKKIVTEGDQVKDSRLSDVGGKGLFSNYIEKELMENKIDIAVHALKDMPAKETDGLRVDTFLERNDPREVLISKEKKKLRDLKAGSVIGTSSYRRDFQIQRIRSDVNCQLVRGNVDTRIKKLKNKLYDAIILSYAGLKSLKMVNSISQVFSLSEIIPSAGQGVIALQCRKNDNEIIKLLKDINHLQTEKCANAERDVLKVLDGDCETPVGVNAKIKNKKLTLSAELFSLDGKKRFYLKSSKKINLASLIGKELGEKIKKRSKNLYKKR